MELANSYAQSLMKKEKLMGVPFVVVGDKYILGWREDKQEELESYVVLMLSEDETADWETYRNEEYGFELIFPDRWKDCEIKERENNVNFRLKMEEAMIFDNGHKEDYSSIFNIRVYSKKGWDKIQSLEGPKPTYLNENNDYVFAFSMGHDDSGFAGFPEVKLNEEYQGPFYDVKNRILPTFKFIEK